MSYKAGAAILAIVGVFSIVPGASSQVLSLSCEHKSGVAQGQVFSTIVDFSTRTVRWENRVLPTTIDDQFITFAIPHPNGYRELKRIDLITGQFQFSHGNSPWDTVFGQPGIICREVPPIGR
jgi:hypothetical protein